jgi:MraZ protein
VRFLGNSEAKIDAKGRVFLPSTFRKQLQTATEECLIMRKDTYQSCLVLYPESVWNEQMNDLRSRLNRWNAKHQMLFRQFVADVEIVTLDNNGRLLIPKRYLKLVNISQDVRLIGMDDTIEIWPKEALEQQFMDIELFGKELEEIMDKNKTEARTL